MTRYLVPILVLAGILPVAPGDEAPPLRVGKAQTQAEARDELEAFRKTWTDRESWEARRDRIRAGILCRTGTSDQRPHLHRVPTECRFHHLARKMMPQSRPFPIIIMFIELTVIYNT